MFKKIFACEWQRLWLKKSTWLCLIIIPLVVFASLKYYLGVNKIVNITDPKYTSFANCAVAALQEQLLIFFNMIVIFLTTLSITQEFRSGEIRFILLRTNSPCKLFFAKFLTINLTVALFLLIYFLSSYALGYFMLPKLDKIHIFYHNTDFNFQAAFSYSVKYYLIALLTLIAMSCIVSFICAVSKSVSIAIGLSLGVFLGMLAYPTAVILFLYRFKIELLQMFSLTQIQFEGIAKFLGASSLPYIIPIIFIYMIIFFVANIIFYSKADQIY